MSERTLFPIPQPYPQSNGQANLTPTLKELAGRIRQLHDEIRQLLATTTERAWNVGNLLLQAKGQLSHGQWVPWLEKHCPFAIRTAQRYMQLVTDFPKFEDIKNDKMSHLLTTKVQAEFCKPDESERPAPAPPTPEQEAQATTYVNENAIESVCELMQAKRITPSDALKISRLTDAEQQAASIHIQSNGTVCASDHVDTLIKEITGTRATAPVKDSLGNEVPKKLRDIFADETALDFCKQLQQFFRCIKKDRSRYFFFHRKEFFKACGDLEAMIEESLPHSLCSTCKGKGRTRSAECRRCLGQGYISQGIYTDELSRNEPDWEGAQ